MTSVRAAGLSYTAAAIPTDPNESQGFAQPNAVNDSGNVAGVWAGNGPTNAFFWDGAAAAGINLGDLAAKASRPLEGSQALAINSDGVVIGIGTDKAGHLASFIWDKQNGLAILPGFDATSTDEAALAINNNGQVVGWANVKNPDGSINNRAFVWKRGDAHLTDAFASVDGNTIAVAINDDELVLGAAQVDPLFAVPFIDFLGTQPDLKRFQAGHFVASFAFSTFGLFHGAINASGHVAGGIGGLGSLYWNGKTITFSPPEVVASGLTDDDQIVGSLQQAAGSSRAVIWQGGIPDVNNPAKTVPMTDLNTTLTNATGWTLNAAVASSAGKVPYVVGIGSHNTTQLGFVLQPANGGTGAHFDVSLSSGDVGNQFVFHPNAKVHVTARLMNRGPQDVKSVRLTVTIPDGTEFVSVKGATKVSAPKGEAGGDIVLTVNKIQPSSKLLPSLVDLVLRPSDPPRDHTHPWEVDAKVSAVPNPKPNGPPPVTVQGNVAQLIQPYIGADLDINLVDSDSFSREVPGGETTTYGLQIINRGPEDAPSVQLDVDGQFNTEYVSAVREGPGATGPQPVPVANTGQGNKARLTLPAFKVGDGCIVWVTLKFSVQDAGSSVPTVAEVSSPLPDMTPPDNVLWMTKVIRPAKSKLVPEFKPDSSGNYLTWDPKAQKLSGKLTVTNQGNKDQGTFWVYLYPTLSSSEEIVSPPDIDFNKIAIKIKVPGVAKGGASVDVPLWPPQDPKTPPALYAAAFEKYLGKENLSVYALARVYNADPVGAKSVWVADTVTPKPIKYLSASTIVAEFTGNLALDFIAQAKWDGTLKVTNNGSTDPGAFTVRFYATTKPPGSDTGSVSDDVKSPAGFDFTTFKFDYHGTALPPGTPANVPFNLTASSTTMASLGKALESGLQIYGLAYVYLGSNPGPNDTPVAIAHSQGPILYIPPAS